MTTDTAQPQADTKPEPIRIRAHDGPQRKFLTTRAEIAIYGGAAGGGKTFAILLEPLRHIKERGFQAATFRRTSEQIRTSGGLWDESCVYYPITGAKGREQQLDWRWSTGAKVRFEQLQHEDTKYEYQGAQICLLQFDELTHFTEGQWWYMLGRNRSVCGVRPYVRATTNPLAGSWVAKLIDWWIDPVTGYAIPERSGVVRWFLHEDDETRWFDSIEQVPAGKRAKSLTFVPATLADNPTLTSKDPGYEANLHALPRIERERLLGGNWKAAEGAIIDSADLVGYTLSGENYRLSYAGQDLIIPWAACRRFAVIDTAGTSREKAEEQRGKPPSYSVCSIWDYSHTHNLLLLHHVWRERVGWTDLKRGVMDTLKTHRCNRAYIENAHHGPALKDELGSIHVEMVGPVIEGMTESNRGAKLERAIAGGLLTRFENHRLFVPAFDLPWVRAYRTELTSWTGLPDETADQIDVSSYASFLTRRLVTSWGGVVGKPIGGIRR